MVFKARKIRKARKARETAFKELNRWEDKLERAAKKVERLKEELRDIK